jgi:hypothetical protein
MHHPHVPPTVEHRLHVRLTSMALYASMRADQRPPNRRQHLSQCCASSCATHKAAASTAEADTCSARVLMLHTQCCRAVSKWEAWMTSPHQASVVLKYNDRVLVLLGAIPDRQSGAQKVWQLLMHLQAAPGVESSPQMLHSSTRSTSTCMLHSSTPRHACVPARGSACTAA